MLFVKRKHSGAIAGKPHERPEATRQALCHLLGLTERDSQEYYDTHRMYGTNLSFLVVVFLTLQNAGFILLLRHLRIQLRNKFLNTSAVYFSEHIKILISLIMIINQSKSISNVVDELSEE
ncbi:hypothetical protein GJ496_010818 [Pomphorhynchus laevis]|nr:hypothetical protein GJ496_010818 [Pomphorhynchus laevis]